MTTTTATAPVIVIGDELAYPSDYLSFVDLKGKPRTVTIEDIWKEKLERKGKKQKRDKAKLIVTLVGKEKKWAINVTNATMIAKVYGPQALDWRGKKVVIQPDTCTFGRDTVNCIRVNEALTRAAAGQPVQAPAPPPAQATPPPVDETWDEHPPVDEDELARGAAEAEASS